MIQKSTGNSCFYNSQIGLDSPNIRFSIIKKAHRRILLEGFWPFFWKRTASECPLKASNGCQEKKIDGTAFVCLFVNIS